MLIHRYSCDLCKNEIPTDWLTKTPDATFLSKDACGRWVIKFDPVRADAHICRACWDELRRLQQEQVDCSKQTPSG